VPRAPYCEKSADFLAMLRNGGIFTDVKSVVDRKLIPGDVRYRSL
jgi:hypothetical protein